MDGERLRRIVGNIASRPIISIGGGNGEKQSRWEILAENLLDSLIDGAIAGMTTGYLANPDIGWKVAFANGFVKFLIRLKELRGKT